MQRDILRRPITNGFATRLPGAAPRWVAAAVLVGAASGAGAAIYGFGPAEIWTVEQITTLTTTVANRITDFGSSFYQQSELSFQQVISAIAVATKQDALSGGVVTDGIRESAQQLANAVRAQNESTQVAEAVMNYSAVTGQGYAPCDVLAQGRTLDMAFDARNEVAKQAVAAMGDLAPGALVQSVPASMSQRLTTHREKFCTQAEAEAGLCTLSALPGGDVNATLLFEPATSGSLEQQAQSAFIQHVLGEPNQAVSAEAGRSAAGESYLLAKNAKDSLLSIPAYSLKMIQVANTRSSALGDKSPNEVLKLRINALFGGDEAAKWAGALAVQTPRGLLVEAVKLQGLEAWMHYQGYLQNQRLEANLAALTLAEAAPLQQQVQAEYSKLRRNNVAAKVN